MARAESWANVRGPAGRREAEPKSDNYFLLIDDGGKPFREAFETKKGNSEGLCLALSRVILGASGNLI